MKALIAVVCLAFVTACLVALAWHRPDPKHQFIFDLVRSLSETNSIATPPTSGRDTPAKYRGGEWLSMISLTGGLA